MEGRPWVPFICTHRVREFAEVGMKRCLKRMRFCRAAGFYRGAAAFGAEELDRGTDCFGAGDFDGFAAMLFEALAFCCETVRFEAATLDRVVALCGAFATGG